MAEVPAGFRQCSSRQRGSVLMLMPAAVLVFLVLGALAVDFAVVFLAHRELANAAVAAANDAATEALDVGAFYADGTVRLVPGRAEDVALSSIGTTSLEGLRDVQATVSVTPGSTEVTVTVTAEVGSIFSKAIPGGPESTTVTASAVATAEEGPATSGPALP